MSDKHSSKQKAMRAKSHLVLKQAAGKGDVSAPGIEKEIKETAGTAQEGSQKIRAAANNAHKR